MGQAREELETRKPVDIGLHLPVDNGLHLPVRVTELKFFITAFQVSTTD